LILFLEAMDGKVPGRRGPDVSYTFNREDVSNVLPIGKKEYAYV